MKTHTNNFKTNISTLGRQLDSVITYSINNTEYTITSEDLNSITPSYEGNILKSVMKQLDIDSNINIPVGTIINYKFGVLVDNVWEYLDFGNYVVYESEKQEDYDSYKITCYDKMLYSMIQNRELDITYPITIRDYISAICTELNLEFANSSDTFVNYNRQIPEELYLGQDYTFRDILDNLAEVTASTICINSSDKLEIRYLNETNEVIDEEMLKDININFGKLTDAVNTIVLSRSGDSDKISQSYPTNLEDDEKVSITITDNLIMNDNNRADYIPEILNKLKGLQFVENDYVSTGITYLELCDKYTVSIGNNTYSCIMLNDEIEITQGLVENIHCEKISESATDYTKVDSDDRRINEAWIIVNKQEQTIESLTKQVETIDTQTAENTQLIQDNLNEFNDKLNGYALKNDLLNVETSVSTLQTNTYSKTEVNQILTGTLNDNTKVEYVSTKQVLIDKDGITVNQTGDNESKTKTNLDADGLEIIDKTGASNEVLLEAKYDSDINETIVRSKRMKVEKYLTVGTHSRFEDYENGTGCFYLGGY